MNTSASTAVRRDPGWTTRARRDLAIVVLASLVAALLCIKLNVSEVLLSWTRPHERFQLDELPAVLLVLAACLSWFSARRFGEARRELALRRSAEERLSRNPSTAPSHAICTMSSASISTRSSSMRSRCAPDSQTAIPPHASRCSP